MAFRVVLDACVLYPFSLRDALLRMAERELYEPYWSKRILEETSRNLIANGVAEAQADRLIEHMTLAFDGAMVPEAKIQSLEPAMENHPKDRHVLAAAEAIGAEAVVTVNTRDFPEEACAPLGIEAVHPDDFLLGLVNIDPDGVREAVKEQAADLQNPPLTVDELLDSLARSVPRFAQALRRSV